jgi:hypothetical protein
MSKRDPGSPLVSVIVPVHDRFRFAERAVLSVWSQTYRPIELIIVDDASVPAFAAPPEAFDLACRVVRLDANLGPGAAREAGRAHARGEFIAYLDSDDFWGPIHLASLVAAMSAAPGVSMGYSAALEVRHTQPPRLRPWSDTAHAAILPALLWRRPWHTSACLWRRGLADAVGGWMPIWHYEDYEYDCRAGCLGAKLAHVPEPTCFVQTDAPDRLSASPEERRKSRGYGLAALSMAEAIRRTPWNQDPRIRDRMRELLLSAAAKAAEQNLGGLAARAIFEIWRWPAPSASLAVASGVGLPLALMSAGHVSGRIFRWARSRSVEDALRPDDDPGEGDPSS